jgi:hypothetical protein
MIYLSGPITNSDPEVQKENLKRFYEVEAVMDEHCFNPARLEKDGTPYENYLVDDLLWIIANRPNKLYMLKGWQNSLGARIEHRLAEKLGIDIEYEKEN